MRLKEIYRQDVRQPSDRSLVEEFLELTLKCVILFSIPVPISAGFTWIWYHLFFIRGICFNVDMEAIIVTAWVTVFGWPYGLIVQNTLAVVWSEYKEMRWACKRGVRGVIDFVRLRDERVPPLIYALLCILPLFVLLAFMLIKYPCVCGGVCAIASSSYLFALIFTIIKELDNPCGGLWYIRRISREWLNIDTEKFREAVSKLSLTEREDEEVLQKIINDCQIPPKD